MNQERLVTGIAPGIDGILIRLRCREHISMHYYETFSGYSSNEKKALQLVEYIRSQDHGLRNFMDVLRAEGFGSHADELAKMLMSQARYSRNDI